MTRRKVTVRGDIRDDANSRSPETVAVRQRRTLLRLVTGGDGASGNFRTGALHGAQLEPTLERLHVLGTKVTVALVELYGVSDLDRAVRRLVTVLDISEDGLCFEHDPGCVAIVMLEVDQVEALRRLRQIKAMYEASTPTLCGHASRVSARDGAETATPTGGSGSFMAGLSVGSSSTTPQQVIDGAVSALIRAKSWGGAPIVCADLRRPLEKSWPVAGPVVDGGVAIAANEPGYALSVDASRIFGRAAGTDSGL